MAKMSNVQYALAVEKLRGKLATKQQDIVYSTQVDGAGVSSALNGVREALNFQKYMVLTVRNGKNMFYVKSRTSVKLSTATRRAQAALGAGSLIALAYIRKNGDNIQEGLDNVALAYEDYVRRTGDKCGLRGYICKTIVQQLRLKAGRLTVPGVLDPSTGLQPIIGICDNPFVGTQFAAEPLDTLTGSELAIMRGYLPQLSNFVTVGVAAFSANGTLYPVYALTQTDTIDNWLPNLGILYGAEVEGGQMTLGVFNERTNKPVVIGRLMKGTDPVAIDQDSTWASVTTGTQVYVEG